jgi:FMN phosphatase YigB (HAD superfamily)
MAIMTTLFFDFDDTLSEQIPFNLQYVRGLGHALAPLHGGDVEAWASKAADMMVALEIDYIGRFRNAPLSGYCEWLPSMLANAVALLFGGMNLPLPADAEAVARQMRRAALHECNSLFPGAQQMFATLHARYGPLHMASGNDSDHLRAAMKGAGLLDYVDRLYGPDLIDCAKEGPEFYERLLADMRLSPSEALFIDNDPAAIGWIHAVGAQAIQVKLLPYHRPETAPGVRAVVDNLSNLADEIRRLDGSG